MSKDRKKRSSTETARRIWLAGIGAYGRAFTEAQEALKDVTGKGSDVFDELVQKGEMLEMVGKAKGKEMREKAKIPDIDLPDFDMPDFDLNDRIKAMRDRLSRGTANPTPLPTPPLLEERIRAMEVKLDQILNLLGEPKKPAPKKAAPKKATAKKKLAQKKPTPKTTKAKKVTTQRTVKK